LYEFSIQHPQYFALMFVDREVPRISQAYERFAFARTRPLKPPAWANSTKKPGVCVYAISGGTGAHMADVQGQAYRDRLRSNHDIEAALEEELKQAGPKMERFISS
jgi:hypothetical protein